MNELQQALALLDRFELGEFVQPSEAERLLVQVFEACGYPVTEKGFVGSATSLLEVDCFIRTKVDGSLKTIAVEVKAGSRPAGLESVEQAFRLKTNGPFDRAMIVSRLGFSPDAPAHQHHLFSIADVADHRCRIVRKNTGHRRQVADVPVHAPEQGGDCLLVRRDRI